MKLAIKTIAWSGIIIYSLGTLYLWRIGAL